jgi:hypothetical protein
MVIGFEDLTAQLTDKELSMIPLLVRTLEGRVGAKNAITNLSLRMYLSGQGVLVEGPRIRKMINHIRINQLVRNLIATSKGYYIAASDEELKEYIKGLKQRASSILLVAQSYK